MQYDDYSELEEKLRSLPTAGPPAELRDAILSAAPPRRARPRLQVGFAFALLILFLLALDIAVERVQSARINRLLGGNQPALARYSQPDLIVALSKRQQLLIFSSIKELR